MVGNGKRRSYTLEYKLSVIEYAKQHSVRSTSVHYGIDRRQVTLWKSDEKKYTAALLASSNSDSIKRKRKLHPGPSLESSLRGQVNARKHKVILIDLWDLLDWHTSIKRSFQVLKTLGLTFTFNVIHVTNNWVKLIDKYMERIRTGDEDMTSLENVFANTLRELCMDNRMHLLVNESDKMLMAWERSNLYRNDTIHALESLRRKFTLVQFGTMSLDMALRVSKRLHIQWDTVLSPDMMGNPLHQNLYPPESQVYFKATDLCNVQLDCCTLITSNSSALQIGQQVGLRTCYIRRSEEAPLLSMDIETHSNVIVSSIEEAAQMLLHPAATLPLPTTSSWSF